ncbi:hypothetical protein [Pseudomonas abieticivorans]|uniref:hypothetical protein n=1 Tax=Pseudomonas abieticivorans TaxID=2931382 RepID=UPI0020BE90BA|nr:hypothetical protein [Pseudomonas sp. PIA16]
MKIVQTFSDDAGQCREKAQLKLRKANVPFFGGGLLTMKQKMSACYRISSRGRIAGRRKEGKAKFLIAYNIFFKRRLTPFDLEGIMRAKLAT